MKEINKAEKAAFLAFGMATAMSNVVAEIKDDRSTTTDLQLKFAPLWAVASTIMNEVDEVAEHIHAVRMDQMPEKERTIYSPISDGYDEFASDLYDFCELWINAHRRSRTNKLMNKMRKLT